MAKFIKLLVSVMSQWSQTFFVDFLKFLLKRPHLKNIKKYAKKINLEYEIQYNNNKEEIDSYIELITNFF